MYKHIFIPVDNSEHSNKALELGLLLAKAFGAKATVSHIYAAKMHDVRFKQMEFTLPEEYQEENELMRQRKIHDSLISMGLQLISDSYLDVAEKMSASLGVELQRKMMDGKNWECLVKDIEASDYDLVVMGAMGTGAVKHSLLGSVCERVVRRTSRDILIVKDTAPLETLTGPVVVGLDGSPQSFYALKVAFALETARKNYFPKKSPAPEAPLKSANAATALLEAPAVEEAATAVQAVAVFDPYLHYIVFNGIVDVLSEKASKVFRFKDQEQLHEDIIDTGLAKIYQSHLDVAKQVARDQGAQIEVTLKDGKAFEKVYELVARKKAAFLILGKVGIHNGASGMDIGSNAENLLRLSGSNVLLTSGKFVPPVDVKAEASMVWTEEAGKRFERVPEQVRNIARTAVHRHAMERGHSIITNSIIDEVMAIFMPRSAQKMQELAVEVAKNELEDIQSRNEQAFVCSICGKIVRGLQPVVCTVCGAPGSAFGLIEKKDLEALSREEGAVEEEETFDGVKVSWTQEARNKISHIKDGYIRRRARAQLEKAARTRRLSAVDAALVDEILGRDVKDPSGPPVTPHASLDNELASPLPLPEKWDKKADETPQAPDSGRFTWSDDAAARLNRVPSGFMRENTRKKIEEFALEKGAAHITLDIAEGGIEKAKQVMAEMISAYTSGQYPKKN